MTWMSLFLKCSSVKVGKKSRKFIQKKSGSHMYLTSTESGGLRGVSSSLIHYSNDTSVPYVEPKLIYLFL